MPLETTCGLLGVAKSCIYAWVARGREDVAAGRPRTNYALFADAFVRARAINEWKLLERIQRAGERDWRASAWILERRFPERWSQKASVEVSVDDKAASRAAQAKMDGLREILSTDEGAAYADAIVDRMVEETLAKGATEPPRNGVFRLN
ncbi:MAG: hypothetical protein ABI231_05910 [Candidatus Tumulicola sp.]